MKYVALISVIALVFAGTASAAKDPRVPVLQGQIIGLQVELVKMENIYFCQSALQQEFNIATFNAFAYIFGQSPYSGDQPNDGGACSKVGVGFPRVAVMSALSPWQGLVAAFNR